MSSLMKEIIDITEQYFLLEEELRLSRGLLKELIILNQLYEITNKLNQLAKPRGMTSDTQWIEDISE